MKRMLVPLLLLVIYTSLAGCKKDAVTTETVSGEAGFVTGKVTDARGNGIQGVRITIEHTVWFGNYVYATTDEKGNYKVSLPAEPAGSWTAKAKIEKTAWGQSYIFDLHPGNTEPFNRNGSAVRDFTWKLSGKRPGADAYYGAHLDLYQFGTDVPMDKVKIVFTPATAQLIDGSTAVAIERTVEDVAGTFMARDIPMGRYSVKAVYPGKTLLLDNRHDSIDPEANKTFVFGKNGYLAESEYNVEFWIGE